ncbi:MAG: serine hydrolase [Candidatus Levybacteria bacterium]|nr:serine hydrolase [Candidatus Levybacteria bacterium]
MGFFLFLFKLLALVVGGALLITLSLSLINGKNTATSSNLISPLAQTQTQEVQSENVANYLNPGMKLAIDQALEGTTGTYAIYFKKLKTGETYAQNENLRFQSASLYKLLLMATAFRLMHDDKLDENELLRKDAADLNRIFDIASESAELKEGEVSMTVKDAIEKSIVISHNYAALLLSNRVKISTMRLFLKNEGFSSSNVGQPPQTTALDIASFYEKLYNGTLVNKEYSDRMLAILKGQQLNDRIPKYLPEEVLIAHKTGELQGFKHDAGIVFSPDADYILVILSESNNPKMAAERIAQVSKAVYSYLQKSK